MMNKLCYVMSTPIVYFFFTRASCGRRICVGAKKRTTRNLWLSSQSRPQSPLYFWSAPRTRPLATSGQVGFSILNSSTSGYTAQNQRGEQHLDKPALDLLHFAVKYGLERLGRPDVLIRNSKDCKASSEGN